jgi:hypothetical protein
MRRALVGSDRLGSGCLVLRADTRENPGGKNGVMTRIDTCMDLSLSHYDEPILKDMSVSATKRWTLTLLKFDEPFGVRFHFERFLETDVG